MNDPSSDPQLDAQLRDVPVAENFLDRLKSALVPSDEALDKRLSDVRVPGTLAARLQAIPDDVALDQQVAAVDLSPTLIERLYAIPHERLLVYRKRSPARRAAEATTLFVGLSTSLALAVMLIVRSVYPEANEPITVAGNQPTIEMVLPSTFVASADSADALSEPQTTVGDVEIEPQPLRTEWVNFQSPESALTIDPITSDLLGSDQDEEGGPVGQWASLSHGGLRMMDDVVLMKFGVLGSPQYASDALPELETPWIAAPRGIEPPLVRGYDRIFFLKNRLFPAISPGANPELQTLRAPISVDTRSYRRARQLLARQRLPGAGEVRVEDFLAALDYRWPAAAPGQLALRTASGPSPFGPSGAGLLQVGVQAGPIARKASRTSHLVLAIDASKSMGRAGRWTEVRYAVQRTLSQLTEKDHLSIVVVHDDSVHRWEDIGRDEAAAIARQLEQIEPSGGSNLSLGLQQAVSVAMSQELAQTEARRVVLISDDPSALPVDQRAPIRALFDEAAEAGVALDVIDLGEAERPLPLLGHLASEHDGDYRRLSDGRAMYWMLVERLSGQSSVVASEARLSIKFNPQAVAAYRLIGHEANALAGLSPPSLAVDMHATDAATTLVELWLQPGDVDDVGEATVTWLDPETGEERRRTQRISRLQFAPTFSEAAPSLQAAAIAAETAELLRGSRETLRQANPSLPRPSWEAVASAVEQANPVLNQWPDFRELRQLIEQAAAAKP